MSVNSLGLQLKASSHTHCNKSYEKYIQMIIANGRVMKASKILLKTGSILFGTLPVILIAIVFITSVEGRTPPQWSVWTGYALFILGIAWATPPKFWNTHDSIKEKLMLALFILVMFVLYLIPIRETLDKNVVTNVIPVWGVLSGILCLIVLLVWVSLKYAKPNLSIKNRISVCLNILAVLVLHVIPFAFVLYTVPVFQLGSIFVLVGICCDLLLFLRTMEPLK